MFNEVFLDDVFVPDDCVVGEVDRGWKVARNTLTNERVSIGSSGRLCLASLELLEFFAAGTSTRSRRRGGRLVAEGHAVKLLGLRRRCRSSPAATRAAPQRPQAAVDATGQESPSTRGRIGAAAAVGDLGEADRPVGRDLLASRAMTIYGGTTEVQLNIIAERLLGLPRDP